MRVRRALLRLTPRCATVHRAWDEHRTTAAGTEKQRVYPDPPFSPLPVFRTVQPTVWAFDCEWVPDADAGRCLLGLDPEMPEEEVFEAMWAHAGATPDAPRPFLKTVACRVASIAVVERRVCTSGEVALHLCALPRDADDPEDVLLTAFFDALARRRPQLVGFNSHGADLKVLVQRGVVRGLAAPGLCRRPDRPWEGPDYFHPHSEWNVDLMRILGGRGAVCPTLHEIATLSGIPCKALDDRSTSGADVAALWLAGRRHDIRRYNEVDAVTTYLLWLRTARFAGLFSSEEMAEEEGRLEALLEHHAEEGKTHLGAFLDRWRIAVA